MIEIKCLTQEPALCGESPVWDCANQLLYWTDISGKQIHVYNPKTGKDKNYRMPGRIGCFARRKQGGFIAAMEDRFVCLDEKMVPTDLAITDITDLPNHRFNDGKTDRTGRFFWAGSMDMTRKLGNAGLWRLGTDGSAKKMLNGLFTSNGLAWSPDGSLMYHTDSFKQTLWIHDYCIETGSITNRRILRKFTDSEGRPDGAAIDSSGYYWTALYRGAKIMRLTPYGDTDRVIDLPVICPTMCAFGGKDLSTMYVTSASENLSRQELEQYPLSGHLFEIDLDVKGLQEPVFGD